MCSFTTVKFIAGCMAGGPLGCYRHPGTTILSTAKSVLSVENPLLYLYLYQFNKQQAIFDQKRLNCTLCRSDRGGWMAVRPLGSYRHLGTTLMWQPLLLHAIIWWSLIFAHTPFRVVFIFAFLEFYRNFKLNPKFEYVIPFY